MVIYSNVTVMEYFNEFAVNLKHRMILILLLEKMEEQKNARLLLNFLKDLVEDTNNNVEAMLVYE